MRKRIAAGLIAASATMSVWSAAPASAFDDSERDAHPAIPCNVYPPGKPFQVTAAPATASVKLGAYLNSVAVVRRGVGADRKPCKYHLVMLRYPSKPGVIIKSHRTGENGAVGFVVGPVRGTFSYYYEMVNGSTRKFSNMAKITAT